MISNLFILGGMGDLTSRYLLPALVRLEQAGRLPAELRVTGVSREQLDRPAYRQHMAERLAEHAADADDRSRQALIARLDYHQVDVTDAQQMAGVLGELDEPAAVYLALPPTVYAATIETLGQLGLPAGSVLVVEKPFGQDLASAQALNRLLHETFAEESVFRIDHFLGMATVQDLLGLRFANRLFGHLWDRDQIERVEIIWDETLALEGRAAYYDSAGAVRDMIQNHLLQLLCLVAMEAPVTLAERDLRDRKVDVLRAVRRLSPEEVERLTVRARYAAGRIGDRELVAYVDEPGVDPQGETETFAQITLLVDNWRWAGVPFVLRTGKALPENRYEIAVYFRPVPHLAFEESGPAPNVLRIQLIPGRLTLTVDINGRGDMLDLERAELTAELAPQALPEYARLLLDILHGRCTLSIRADEAEQCWQIVDPILQAWQTGRVPLRQYPAGTLPQ